MTFRGMYLLTAIASASCGRIAYDAQPANVDGGEMVDATPPDAIDAPVTTTLLEFGNGASADFSTGTRDTFIYQAEAGNNFGTDLLLDGYEFSHSLLFFDLSPIDPSSTLSSAALCVTPILNDALVGSGTIHLVTQEWEEGVESGAPGAPNWTQRTASSNWTTPGGDFGAVIASFSGFTNQVRVCIDLDVGAVQEWVRNPSMNLGLGTVSEAYPDGHPHLCSREAADASCRPALKIEVVD